MEIMMPDTPHHPPTIELDTACLRPLRADDAAALFAYLSNPAVTELTSYPDVALSLAEAMIERSRTRWAAGEPSRWAVALRADDQLIGTCGFNDFSRPHRWAELAYELAEPHWGKGLISRAVSAALDWVFQQDQVDRVQAYVRVDNARSQRVLDRAGFTREGRLRNYRICRGQPHDFFIYSLLRSDLNQTQ